MSDYSITTDFSVKDSLASGDTDKLILGSELDTEFNAIATAIASKLDKTGGDNGSFTPTHTGFSSDPSGDIEYSLNGGVVTLVFEFSVGTSDGTGWTITNLPASLHPAVQQILLVPACIDSGSDVDGCTVQIATDGTITLGKGFQGDAWTGSGSKGFGSADYAVTYSLNAEA